MTLSYSSQPFGNMHVILTKYLIDSILENFETVESIGEARVFLKCLTG